MSGAFGAAALELHKRGLAVIPTGKDDGKSPLVKGWSEWRGQLRSTVEQFVKRHAGANVGVLTGLSRLTVIDCDDENTLADAEQRFGKSPLVTRSPRGGGHLYFRSSGERNANLRREGLNIDVRGVGGLVLVPPSVRAGVGAYRIERGSWDDVATLPRIQAGAIPPRQRAQAPQGAVSGERNNRLYSALLDSAQACQSLAELALEAHAINAQFSPPLTQAEAEKVARSVWSMKEQGRLLRRGQQRIQMLPIELERLRADAFFLAAWIRKWHGAKRGQTFALSTKAMARDDVIPGWGRRRYMIAIAELRAAGVLTLDHQGGAKTGDTSLYRMGAPSEPNITRHPPLRFPLSLALRKVS